MADIRTEVTEIVTGLGMTGSESLEGVLNFGDAPLANVTGSVWERLRQAYHSEKLAAEFSAAWCNGRFFLAAGDGLRGRIPLSVAWKGPHKAVGYELVPADLRVDHVYLVSCKYLSKVLHNVAPPHVFDRLAQRTGPKVADWYAETALEAYQSFYDTVRESYDGELPARVTALSTAQRAALRSALPKRWDGDAEVAYRSLAESVAEEPVERWRAALGNSVSRQEEMLWRLLRLSSASYFVLGSSSAGPMRLRIGTPWDWRQRFTMVGLDVRSIPAGQPVVGWRATVRDKHSGSTVDVDGHVEVRWSHGRFSSVEAKVYLDTSHADVPGYFPIH